MPGRDFPLLDGILWRPLPLAGELRLPGEVSISETFLRALDAGDAVRAREALIRLRDRALESGAGGGELAGAWERFRSLLHRRGYYVCTPEELASTLDEILKVGAGFDLFDLAVALAAYDEACGECLGLAQGILLPEIGRFAPPCTCGKHKC